MATKKLIDRIQESLAKEGLKPRTVAARSWLRSKVKDLTPSKTTFMRDQERLRNKSMIGRMYFYFYDPKTKDKLPYYDMFPLVFPFKRLPDGFVGLNMHYLPYQMRVLLLQRLMDFSNNKNMDETTRLKYSWSMIDGVSRYRLAEPCVKRYLASHVKTNLRLVPATDWATAMLLPVEQFVGSTKTSVWQNSLR